MATEQLLPRRAQPSLKSGYARNAAESANPGLWDGLEHCYVPLGFGSVAFDLSKHNNAENTRTTGASIVLSRGRLAFTFNNDSTHTYTSATNVSANMTGTGPMTFGFWLRSTNTTSTIAISHWGTQASGGNQNQWTTESGTLNGRFHNCRISSPSSINNGEWRSVFAVKELSATVTELAAGMYIDGKPVSFTVNIGGATTVSWQSSAISIGDSPVSNPFIGDIGGAYLYSRTLTDAEIAILHADPLAPFRLKPRLISIPVAAPAATNRAISVARHAPPSLRSGYARSAAESLHPDLWRGCLGFWSYDLGSNFEITAAAADTGAVIRNLIGPSGDLDEHGAHLFSKHQGAGAAGLRVTSTNTTHFHRPGLPSGFGGESPSTVFVQAFRTQTISTQEWLCYFNADTGTAYHTIGVLDTGEVRGWVYNGSSAARRDTTATDWFSMVNQPVAICSSKPYGSGTTRGELYIDGEHVTDYSDTTSGQSNNNVLGFGRADLGSAQARDFAICAIAVWERELTAAEAQLITTDALAPFRLRPRTISIPAAAPAATTTTLSIPRHAQPSLKSGYARNAAQSANPGLWDGLLDSWVPLLGPQRNHFLRNVVRPQHSIDIASLDAGATGNYQVGQKGWEYYRSGLTNGAIATNQSASLGSVYTDAQEESVDAFTYAVSFRATWDGTQNQIFLHSSATSAGNDEWSIYHRTSAGNFWFIVKDSTDSTIAQDTTMATESIDGVWQTGFIRVDYKNDIIYFDLFGPSGHVHEEFTSLGANGCEPSFGGFRSSELTSFRAIHSWTRVLSQDEVDLVGHDALAPFRLKPRVISIPAAAGTDITATLGTVTVTGHAANVSAGTGVAASLGTVTVSGQATNVSAGTSFTTTAGAVTVAGQNVFVNRNIAPTTGSIAVSGLAASISAGTSLTAALGTVTVTGLAATVVPTANVNVAAGAVSVTGLAVAISAATDVNVTSGTVSVAGLNASVSTEQPIAVSLGTVGVSGLAVTITSNTSVNASLGAISVSGLNVSVSAGTSLTTTLGTISVSPLSPTIAKETSIAVITGSVSVAPLTATVIAATDIDVTLGTIVVAGVDPIVHAAIAYPPGISIELTVDSSPVLSAANSGGHAIAVANTGTTRKQKDTVYE